MNVNEPLKILVVDDTVTYRSILSEVLKTIPGVELIGTASNGKIALAKMSNTPVDLMLLDVEMPEMSGLETLKIVSEQYPTTGVVMVSGMNRYSADITIKALEAGALDFVPKPETSDAKSSTDELRQRLYPILKLFLARRNLREVSTLNRSLLKKPVLSAPTPVVPERPAYISRPTKFDVVVIGVSTGGPNALNELIPSLPSDLGVPVLVVQHMPPVFTASLAHSLSKKSKLTIKEAEAGERILPNTVYIAPGGKHMFVEESSTPRVPVIGINQDAPENSCRPSVDVLFRSLSNIYGKNILAVIMTGMGSDGANGIKMLKKTGCYCITQSADSCVVYGMPKAIDDMKLSDEQVTLSHLAGRIITLVRKKFR